MLLTLKEYAKKVDRDPATVRQKILRGKLEAQKLGRDWFIEENTPYEDHRFGKNNLAEI